MSANLNIEPSIKIEDGTVYRHAVVRIREDGMNVILDALANAKRGFSKAWSPRFELVDNKLMIVIPSNTGTIDDYQFVGVDVFITLTNEEISRTEKRARSNETTGVQNES